MEQHRGIEPPCITDSTSTSPAHALKCWLRKSGADAKIPQIVGVTPGGPAGGYNALSAVGSDTWQHDFGGNLAEPEGVVKAIAKSAAFGRGRGR